MAARPNVQTITLDDGKLTVTGESPMPRFEVLHVVVVQKGKKIDGVAEGEPLKDSVNWTAVLTAEDFTVGEVETLGVEIHLDPFQVTSWTQRLEIE